jgi:hypothetical protein
VNPPAPRRRCGQGTLGAALPSGHARRREVLTTDADLHGGSGVGNPA